MTVTWQSHDIYMTLIVVLQVHYSSDGRLYATASKDGAIKVQKPLSTKYDCEGFIELLECFTVHVKDVIFVGLFYFRYGME